jgi:putative copper resistance protein D
MIDAAGGFLAVALRFAAVSAITCALGAWGFGRLVIPRVAPPQHPGLQKLAVRTAVLGAVALALATPFRLLVPAASGLAVPAEGTALAAVQTVWGMALVAQGIAAALMAVALGTSRRALPWSRWSDAGLVIVVLSTPFIGHAGSAAELRAVSVLVDIVHVGAAGGWVGTLALLTWSIRQVRRLPEGSARAAELMVAFHPLAVVAAPTVFVTGLAAAWLRMGVPEGIASQSYSGLFVAKLLLVGVTGAIGAGHSKLAARRVRTVNIRAVSRSLVYETLLAVLVLAVTAVLAGTAPIG